MATALYRTYLRAIRRLPHLYLRQFFAVRARTDLDAVVATPDPALRARKLADVARRVRRLRRATTGDVKAFSRILALAYGRVGKLRWELLFPIRTDPSAQPVPIIRNVPSSAPAPYSAELHRLLLTPSPRHKPMSPADIASPRTLPPTADPTSPEAALLGPLSKRREVNIRHRAHAAALRRVVPPLELAVRPRADAAPVVLDPPQIDALRAQGAVYPRPLAMQGLGMLREVEGLVGDTLFTSPPLTRRERRATQASDQISPGVTPQPGQAPNPEVAAQEPAQAPVARHPQRWVRRRYRQLLASLPQLTYDATSGLFEAHVSPLAISTGHRVSHYNPPADPVTLAWLQSGVDADAPQGKKSGKRGAQKKDKDNVPENK